MLPPRVQHRGLDADLVVSAAEVLHEGVPGDDHLCGLIGSEASHRVFITDSPRPRARCSCTSCATAVKAHVEDRIRTGKDSGFGRFPSREFNINAAWLELALGGIDLLAFTRTLLLDGEHALAEPKKLRYRLLPVAARLVSTAGRAILRTAHHWPWANDLAAAYARLAALPRPAG